MRVRVGDARQDGRTVKVHGARGLGVETLCFVGAADPGDAVALNGDGLGGGLLVAHGDNVSVEEKQIGAGSLRRNTLPRGKC